MRLVPALVLLAAVVAAPLTTRAAEMHASLGVSGDRPAAPRAPAPLTGERPGERHGEGRHDRDRDRTTIIIPQVVFVSPGRCWQSGYWTYQWVPQSYAYSTWVEGQWSADGYWIPSHYAPVYYEGGYYQPLWVEGYWTGC